jgi:hypothetical protein
VSKIQFDPEITVPRETAFRFRLVGSAEFGNLVSSALRPIQCILPAMFQISGFMPGDQFNNAGPQP